jgi:predicted nucleic-acid-binding Zn-ribbon protein
MKNGQCSKCDSKKVVPDVRIMDQRENNIAGTLSIQNFPGWNPKTLTAYICSDCGYTELYVAEPQGLWDKYQRAQAYKSKVQ